MGDLCSYADRPFAFIARYLRRRALSHATIVTFVVIACGCAVSTQYGVKLLVDTLGDHATAAALWFAFILLAALIAADNLSWRLASWVASSALVAVAGEPRPVRPSARSRTELFPRPAARDAHRPRHRHLERGIRAGEHVRLERDAAVPGNDRRDRLRRHRQRADGAGAGRDRRHRRRHHVPPGGRRQAAAPRF